jgi:hypothetical protein
LLTHQAGVWQLDSLPGGTKTEAVAAALQLQQEGSPAMLWGSVELTQLLGDLQARDECYVVLRSCITCTSGCLEGLHNRRQC